MDLTSVYLFILTLTVLQRLYELRLAKKNEKKALMAGAKSIKETNYIFMVILHSLWFVSLFYLTLTGKFNSSFPLFATGLVLFMIGQCLRIIAIKTLGPYWNTKIIVYPNSPVIKSGIYSRVKHPNYIGVILEIAALPLMGGYYITALLFSILNLVILFFRIRLEEKMLTKYCDYNK